MRTTAYTLYFILAFFRHFGDCRTVKTEKQNLVFLRRLGPDPHANGAQTAACQGCPDIWELDNGDFAIIGLDISNLVEKLPPTASCGPDERMIRVPRNVLVSAKRDIPEPALT